MKRRIRLPYALIVILMLIMAGAQQPARADGIAITVEESKVEMPAQRAILVWDEEKRHEDLIISVELLGGPEAAWVVPVPALPEVKVANPKWFEHLNNLTKPRIEYEFEYVRLKHEIIETSEVEVEKEVGVELISREEVGIYDVSILSADEPGALLDWLDDNGYAFPDKGGQLLDTYVEEGGWYFVAARVLPGERANLEGDVQPLWLSFDAEQPVYPMRLTALVGEPVDVLVYVMADHRMELPEPSFETDFAGETPLWAYVMVGKTNTDLVDLLTHRTYYISKLRNPAFPTELMTEDLYFKQAPTDEPYRKVITRTETIYVVDRPATARPPTTVAVKPTPATAASEHTASDATTQQTGFLGNSVWLGLGAGLALLAVLTMLGLVWRRSRRGSGEERKV